MPNQQEDKRGQNQGGNQGGDTSKRGFASMDDDKRRDAASKWGESNFKNDPERASEAGRKGGESSRGNQGSGNQGGGGNRSGS